MEESDYSVCIAEGITNTRGPWLLIALVLVTAGVQLFDTYLDMRQRDLHKI